MFEALANINWEVIFQLLFVAMIMLAGPAVIFVLAFRNGDM
ncbi:photosystem II reaction center protein Ycf12/Psb30 [Calothrix sp. 336/3]|nr:photosystem II reaction center protein Ycf12 [Calothrix sp. 336/3]AKG23635.1 photosystem II protein [Calothrix sp. 336/3]